MKRVLSLGAGVQSTTILIMSCVGELEPVDFAVFADTGWEPQVVYDHLDWLEGFAREHGTPVHRISCGRNIKEDALNATVGGRAEKGQRYASMPVYTLGPMGEYGMVRRQCTREFKIDPIKRFLREHLQVPRRKPKPPMPMIEQWFGISMDEKQRMRLADDWWGVNHYPLIEKRMTRKECLWWMERNGFPEPPRSACIGCPYRDNASWREIKEGDPEEWAEAVAIDKAIRHQNKMDHKVYLHRSCVPLEDADLSTLEDHGQQSLFGDDCAGMCGV